MHVAYKDSHFLGFLPLVQVPLHHKILYLLALFCSSFIHTLETVNSQMMNAFFSKEISSLFPTIVLQVWVPL